MVLINDAVQIFQDTFSERFYISMENNAICLIQGTPEPPILFFLYDLNEVHHLIDKTNLHLQILSKETKIIKH